MLHVLVFLFQSCGTIERISDQVAEWLGSGLQHRERQFDPDLGLVAMV